MFIFCKYDGVLSQVSGICALILLVFALVLYEKRAVLRQHIVIDIFILILCYIGFMFESINSIMVIL